MYGGLVKQGNPTLKNSTKSADYFSLSKFKQRRELTLLDGLLRLIRLPHEEFVRHRAQARILSDRLAIFSNFAPARFKSLSARQIERLLSEVRRGVQCLRTGRPWEVTVSASIRVQPAPNAEPRVHVQYTKDLAAAFLASAIQRVATHYKYIAECAAPNCGLLFVKRKAGRYCSAKCSQRVRSSRYYEQHREELSRRRHDAYVERIRREKGRARKVQRHVEGASGK
jgi:hypothetical protein